MYIFCAEGVHYYFAEGTRGGGRRRAGSTVYRIVQIVSEAAHAIADAIYRERGVDRRIEVRYDKNGVPYINLTNVDLELLGLTRP